MARTSTPQRGSCRGLRRLAALLLSTLALPWTDVMAAEIEPEGRDSAAIAVAVQRCQRGDTLRLGEGTFDLSDSIRIKSGIRLLGAGQDKTIEVLAAE